MNPDVIMSPSGVKMKKIIEQTISKSPSGYDLITQKLNGNLLEKTTKSKSSHQMGKSLVKQGNTAQTEK